MRKKAENFVNESLKNKEIAVIKKAMLCGIAFV
jgi:hypothetical protein